MKDISGYLEFYKNIILKKYPALDKRSCSEVYNLDTLKQHIVEKNTEKLFRCLGEMRADEKVIKHYLERSGNIY